MAETQVTLTPVDGSVYVERPIATPAEVERCLEAAVQAQRHWRTVSLSERAEICTRMVEALTRRVDQLALELTWQMGRPIRYTPKEIVGGFAERARYMIAAAYTALADVPTDPKEGFVRFIRREPLGVVLVLAPWNYPYLTSVNSVIPAIMAGNSVVLKHSAQTPLVAERYAEAFAEAGLPEGVFQYLYLSHPQVAQVIADPRIAFVAFTGSVEGGRAVQQAASHRFIGLGLELGGKDPAYVRADADLNFTLENLVDGAMFNSGQSCCGVKRIYVHQRHFKEFVEGFVALTLQYRLGNPLDPQTTLGPVVRSSAAEAIRAQVAEAVSQGAQALIDPRHFPADAPGTAYLAPQVLTGVDHRMRVMREETFGPVVGIMPVAGDAEALELMNDSAYGLTASIWSQDLEAALRLGEQLETGTCFQNRCDYLDPALAWTGVKDSGKGCTLSVVGYEQLTRPKSFHMRAVKP
ncbi:aldehyde dehydrogenase family protein [Meiothermus granaticius]|uniref:Succinate semialdehyde dehydrogenase [NAD(P)+] Sad n=1 Tax=Meiothermus granaticius NBRC 107808 TaxID=1227551 RepID=A0A399FC65_9DEIN|nr:aldehyde dehydrogenase family protein [Meiothermus granaticius]RIH92572.1 Succinate semialdehyde dehydrogenase [NAD(P)+] Sad [Meiothermus granaticius NBRC 107808]GEM88081.1 aldehyde dehydrogenase [Meiothermus granaticius NBRC 107808]